jgi:hypothetical protein
VTWKSNCYLFAPVPELKLPKTRQEITEKQIRSWASNRPGHRNIAKNYLSALWRDIRFFDSSTNTINVISLLDENLGFLSRPRRHQILNVSSMVGLFLS